MKSVIAVVLMMFGFTTYAQEITVRSEQGEDVDFSEFKTFDWASQIDNKLDEGFYFVNDLVLKAQVREAVEGELMGLGYQHADEGADLVVNFRVFDKATTLKSMADYGNDYWGANAGYADEMNQEIDVEAGTLLVSLADKESGKVVWQGFASGLIENNQFIKDEGKITEAVNLIFEDYNQRATEYTRK